MEKLFFNSCSFVCTNLWALLLLDYRSSKTWENSFMPSMNLGEVMEFYFHQLYLHLKFETVKPQRLLSKEVGSLDIK